MDTRRFFSAAEEAFPGDPHTTRPVSDHWHRIAAEVAGYTTPNELAMLAAAVRTLPKEECYVEVGTFKGRSICAAASANPDARMYAIENFMEFGMSGEQAREELMGNLDTWAAEAQVQLLEGDAFALLAAREVVDRPVGVFFYDGEHTLLAHYLALAVIEPLLADEALVLIDDATWPVVQRAHRLFLDRHPGWRVAATWDAATADDPLWANGLHALVFTRERPSRLGRRDRGLLRYQTQVQDRVNGLAWRAADRMPGVVRAGARVVLSRSRRIGNG